MRASQQKPKASERLIDTSEILQLLNLVSDVGQVVELRLLNVQERQHRYPVTLSGYFNEYGALVECARRHSAHAQGTYVTLNPINPALLARAANQLRIAGKGRPLTSDADIAKRRWLPVDFDPVRPAGISSTDEEHETALARAFAVRNALRVEGWPDPIVADSGNGAHLLYRVDLPSDDKGLTQQILRTLAFRFSDDRVKVDETVFNPGRIWKLYGTLSRKGDPLPDRPHRLSRILEAP